MLHIRVMIWSRLYGNIKLQVKLQNKESRSLLKNSDAYKLIRRFMSIFGNIDTELVRRLFIKISALFKNQNNTDMNNQSTFSAEISKILSDLINDTIIRITGKRCRIIIKHCNENTFSTSDATKFIDILKMEGYKVKALFVDYVDVC